MQARLFSTGEPKLRYLALSRSRTHLSSSSASSSLPRALPDSPRRDGDSPAVQHREEHKTKQGRREAERRVELETRGNEEEEEREGDARGSFFASSLAAVSSRLWSTGHLFMDVLPTTATLPTF